MALLFNLSDESVTESHQPCGEMGEVRRSQVASVHSELTQTRHMGLPYDVYIKP